MSEAEISYSLTDSLAAKFEILRCFARLTLEVMYSSCLREYICL